MNPLLREIRHTPLLWMLIFVPVVLAAARIVPAAHTLLFVLAVLAIVPLAALLSHATEAVAEKTGDAVGGLLNATLGQSDGVDHRRDRAAGRRVHAGEGVDRRRHRHQLALHAGSVLSARRPPVPRSGIQSRRRKDVFGLAVDGDDCAARAGGGRRTRSGAGRGDGPESQRRPRHPAHRRLRLGLLFSLKTHKELFASEDHGETEEANWPIGLAVGTLLVVTVLVALVSEIFVESVQKAAETLGMSPAFVGFIIVALVGAAAEMAVAFSAARKNRLDMSVSIALGSASQIALFVAPVLVLLSYVVGPEPMDLQFWPGAVTMVMIATVTATFITNSGRSAWFIGALLIFIYAIFAMTLYMVPPGAHGPV